MNPLRLAVLASGSGSNLQTVIDATQNGRLASRVICVISNKEDAYALERARKHKIEAIYLDPKKAEDGKTYDQRLLEELQKREIDLVVLAGYLKIVTPEVIDAYPRRMINIHPSLLPKYGGQGYYGIHVHQAVVESGDKETGATVHFVDKGIDTGEILIQKKIEVQEDDTAKTLQARVLEQIEHSILVEAIARLERRCKSENITHWKRGT